MREVNAKKFNKRSLSSICTVAIVAIILFCLTAYFLYFRPLGLSDSIELSPNMTVKRLSYVLYKHKIIYTPWQFELWVRIFSQAKHLQAGKYQLNQQMSLVDLIDNMANGNVAEYKYAIIEGTRAKYLLNNIQKSLYFEHNKHALTQEFVKSQLAIKTRSIEGWFFPTTYLYNASTTNIKLLKRAYKYMQYNLASCWKSRQLGLPYKNSYQALIMASIIEKETSKLSERAHIAGVLVNRLRIHMHLGVDPTVIYGLSKSASWRLSKADLKRWTSYNTYLNYGLPPTPIALPSKSSLVAALNPLKTKDLYYVAKGDGSHAFSRTYKQQRIAVQKYQRSIKKS